MTEPVLGIDISKLKFNVCLIKARAKPKHKLFSNNQAGFEQLLAWLSKQEVQSVHACMEATGSYSEPLATFLHQAHHIVSLVNPAAIKAFAGSRLSRTKTDRVDAELSARFCQAQEPLPWTPPAAEVRELQALVRRLESLVEMRVMEENRLSSGITVAAVPESVEELINYFNQQIKRTEGLIHQHINNHPRLKQQTELLDSIPGIAEATDALLLAELTNIKQSGSARQVATRCRTVASGAPVGDKCERPHQTLKDRQCSTAACALLPGHYRPQVQPVLPNLGRRATEARHEQDEYHLCGDAQAHPSGLRGAEVREAVLPAVDEMCLTQNTVSNPAGRHLTKHPI